MAEDEVKKQAEAKSLGALKVIVFNYKDSGKETTARYEV